MVAWKDHILGIVICPCVIIFKPAWAFHVPVQSMVLRTHHRERQYTYPMFMSKESQDQELSQSLPSAYDVTLPAGLRGEAVRYALKSDRGTCVNFTSDDKYNSVKSIGIGVVKVSGKGSAGFLNNKLSNTHNINAMQMNPPLEVEAKTHKVGNENDNENGLEVLVEFGQVKESGLLTSKGRIIDKLTVATFQTEAYMMTSPGHGGSQLFDRLDPFIFPMDGIKLTDMCPTTRTETATETTTGTAQTRVLMFCATDLEVVQKCIRQSVFPLIGQWDPDSTFSFPDSDDIFVS